MEAATTPRLIGGAGQFNDFEKSNWKNEIFVRRQREKISEFQFAGPRFADIILVTDLYSVVRVMEHYWLNR